MTTHMPTEMASEWRSTAEVVLASPEEATRRAVKLGRDRYVELSMRLPLDHPLRVEREQIPEETAVLTIINDHTPFASLGSWRLDFLFALPALVARPVEDLYPPEELVPLLSSPAGAHRAHIEATRARRLKPVHVGEKPGRNEACPCGSGAKVKKCQCGERGRHAGGSGR